MPKDLEKKLKKQAKEKGLKPNSKQFNAYVYGTLRKTGWKPDLSEDNTETSVDSKTRKSGFSTTATGKITTQLVKGAMKIKDKKLKENNYASKMWNFLKEEVKMGERGNFNASIKKIIDDIKSYLNSNSIQLIGKIDFVNFQQKTQTGIAYDDSKVIIRHIFREKYNYFIVSENGLFEAEQNKITQDSTELFKQTNTLLDKYPNGHDILTALQKWENKTFPNSDKTFEENIN
jgi:hypothetical protein